jgi:hypothetical protein
MAHGDLDGAGWRSGSKNGEKLRAIVPELVLKAYGSTSFNGLFCEKFPGFADFAAAASSHEARLAPLCVS